MNPSQVEATWLARAIFLLGAKELFDVGENLVALLLRVGGWSYSTVDSSLYPTGLEVYWIIVSLALGLPMVRLAPSLAQGAIGPRGTRRISAALRADHQVWVSVAVRIFGVWCLIQGVGSLAQAFLHPYYPVSMFARADAERVTWATWAGFYLITGGVLVRRPDVVGLALVGLKSAVPAPVDAVDSGGPTQR